MTEKSSPHAYLFRNLKTNSCNWAENNIKWGSEWGDEKQNTSGISLKRYFSTQSQWISLAIAIKKV